MFRGIVPTAPAANAFPVPPLDPGTIPSASVFFSLLVSVAYQIPCVAVAALLDRLNYGAYKTLLATHRVDWVSMNLLRPEALMAIGVPLGHAIRITDAVAEPLPVRSQSLSPTCGTVPSIVASIQSDTLGAD